MNVFHLAASPFFGGPERQMLGLGAHLGPGYASVYASFPEGGKAQPFLDRAAALGFRTVPLGSNTPRYRECAREVAGAIAAAGADVVCCHGYKADILGWWAARQVGVPVVAVSRGWTGATWKVTLNEWLDRRVLSWADAVVCVSEGQAVKVRRSGVPAERVRVIRNAIDTGRFARIDRGYRRRMLEMFPEPKDHLVGAAGRFSPEKGFGVLLDAAALVAREHPRAGFVLFGDGPLREDLERQAARLGLGRSVAFAGFRDDLDLWLPSLDLFALSSFTEGLPNVVLEAFAAEVPVVATAVGGTPEVVADGVCGRLVPPGDPPSLAAAVSGLLADRVLRRDMGLRGRDRVHAEFTFAAQAARYRELFEELAGGRTPAHAAGGA